MLLGLGQEGYGRVQPQGGPAEALLCLAALFYSEKQIVTGVAAVAEDGGNIPALCGCPDKAAMFCAGCANLPQSFTWPQP